MATKKPAPEPPRKEGYQEEPPDQWPYPPMKREYERQNDRGDERGDKRPPEPRRQN